MLLYLLQYNNYYNRMVKRELDISSYMKYRVTSTLMVNPISCNFNPSDGVYTN